MQPLKLLVIASLLLSACTTVPSDVCPTLVPYSPADQARAADELVALPDQSVIARMIADYGVTRAEIRACLGQQ